MLSFYLLFATLSILTFSSSFHFNQAIHFLYRIMSRNRIAHNESENDLEGHIFHKQKRQKHRRHRLCHWPRLAFEFLVSSAVYVLTLLHLSMALQYLHGNVSGNFLSCFPNPTCRAFFSFSADTHGKALFTYTKGKRQSRKNQWYTHCSSPITHRSQGFADDASSQGLCGTVQYHKRAKCR